MGRAIIREPRVFLMDEPLSNLDAKLRVQMRAEIASLQRDLGVTTIYVTHDQVEALTMGQRIAVMRKGELQQYGPPSDIYDHPTNLFVAGFIGSPPMNLREATLKERDGGQLELELGATHLALDDDETQRVRPSLPELLDRKVVVGIRPEHFEQAPPERRQSNGRVLAATVRLKEALGSDAYVHFALAGATDTLDNAVYRLIHDADDPTTLEERPQTQRATTFIGRFPPRTQAEPGSEFRVAVRPGAIRLFSATTGIAIS
jgi:multiple sugar transport system ATP-binding protein